MIVMMCAWMCSCVELCVSARVNNKRKPTIYIAIERILSARIAKARAYIHTAASKLRSNLFKLPMLLHPKHVGPPPRQSEPSQISVARFVISLARITISLEQVMLEVPLMETRRALHPAMVQRQKSGRFRIAE
jgi:hypothetical protein